MRIFISYSSKNRSLVAGLAADLESLGHEVWFDRELSGGQAWWDEILNSIRACDLFVFALTPQSLDSHPCKLEYTYAHDLRKHILPVMMMTINTTLLPPQLSVIQFVDYRNANQKSTLALIGRAINSLPPAGGLPDPLPVAPEAPIPAISKLVGEIEAPTLTPDEQMAVLHELQTFLSHPETEADAKTLLERFRQRTDLSAKAMVEADSLHEARPSRRRYNVSTPPIAAVVANAAAVIEPKVKDNSRSRLPLIAALVAVAIIAVLVVGKLASGGFAPLTPTPTNTSVVVAVQPTSSPSVTASFTATLANTATQPPTTAPISTTVIIATNTETTTPTIAATNTATNTATITDTPTLSATLRACPLSGVLKVVTAADNAPFESMSSGAPVGFDISLLSTLAQKKGLTLELHTGSSDKMLIAVATGQYDLAIGTLPITNANKQIVNFSNPYFSGGQALVVRRSDAAKFSGTADLSDKIVGVLSNSSSADFVATLSNISSQNVLKFGTASTLFQFLEAGKVDVVISERGLANFYIKSDPGIRITGNLLTHDYYGIAVRKDCNILLKYINDGLLSTISDGEYAGIYRDYFGIDPSSEFKSGGTGIATLPPT